MPAITAPTTHHEFKGRCLGFTSGGAAKISLATSRRCRAVFTIPGNDYRSQVEVFGDVLVVCTDALAATFRLAIKQAEEAYDEEKRLG